MKPVPTKKPSRLKSQASALLTSTAKEINSGLDAIERHHEVFRRASLPSALEIGLQCLKAHQVFAMDTKSRASKAGKGNATTSRREEVTVPNPKSNKIPGSYTEWLARDCPRLKEAVSYKYMKAVGGLQLDHTANPKAILPAIAAWEKDHPGTPITLAALIAASTLLIDNKTPELQQSEFEFFKDCSSDARRALEAIINIKDRLPEDFKRALSAQFYTALWEITGTHWCPTDEAPDIASIDPSAITI